MKERMMRYLLYAETDRQHELGGKGRSLAALQRAGLPVPPWCVLSPRAFYDSLSPQQRRQLAVATHGRDVQPILATLSPSWDVTEEVQTALAELAPQGAWLAVRSSALDEDGIQHSFAGQLESFLFVTPEEVMEKVLAVWRSGFSDRIFAYRREHGLEPVPSAPAIILQRMIDAEVAGVAFSADPVSGRRGTTVVSAVYGLGSALVSGDADADTYFVDRENQIVERRIAEKHTAHRQAPNHHDGVTPMPVTDDLASRPALSDEQVLTITRLSRHAERYFGRPQDIEWALRDGVPYLVQSRPITALARLGDPDGALNLWDNSNIVESYGGITTPLTFSFARTAYEHVYRQFCRLMGVATPVTNAHDATFRRMIGLIHGRIYYNLLSWYRILALLPGFTVNRRFMEQMMGVKEGLPDGLLPQADQATWRDRLQDSLRLLVTCGKLVVNHYTLPRDISRFYRRLAEALAPTQPALVLMRADELAEYYRGLERKLLTHWDAPLVNDFFAMVFYGLLRRSAEKWCGDSEGTLQNDLISGQGGIISAEPARRMREMAHLASQDQAFVEALCTGSLETLQQKIHCYLEFETLYREYLERFGDRCLEELKLESATLHDDPMLLLRSIGQLARYWHDEEEDSGGDLCQNAEVRVRQTLTGHPFRRMLFAWILRNARVHVRDRENLRFERTRLFGRVRRVFLELGKRFMANDMLDDSRDIFYLEVQEIIGVVDGTATTVDLKGLVDVRKAEYARYQEMAPPDDRFATHGIVHQGNDYHGTTVQVIEIDAIARKGIGCCPGVVQGRVQVITDPRHACLEHGAILVAERTDPGWIMLFPAAKGVLVERGSLLSHSAIVAREMRIPAIVSIPGLTQWLRDGDLVEFDGSTGIVRRLEEVSEVMHAQ